MMSKLQSLDQRMIQNLKCYYLNCEKTKKQISMNSDLNSANLMRGTVTVPNLKFFLSLINIFKYYNGMSPLLLHHRKTTKIIVTVAPVFHFFNFKC